MKSKLNSQNNMENCPINRLRIVLILLISVILVNCTSQQRLHWAEDEKIVNIRQQKKSEKIQRGEVNNSSPKIVTFIDKDGKEKIVTEAELDTVTGEYITTMELEEVNIVAKSKTLPERNGMVNIDFVVSVPQKIMQRDWRVVVIPKINNGGEIITLDSLQIRGFANNQLVERGLNTRERTLNRNYITWEILSQRIKKGEEKEKVISEARQKKAALDNFRIDKNELQNTGSRLDTIIQDATNLTYFYHQPLKTENLNTRLRVFFEGYVINVGEKQYQLMQGDSITFIISSMMQFLDRTPRYKRIITNRRVTESLSTNIYFPTNVTEILDTLKNNRVELDKISNKIKAITEGNEYVIDSIIIKSYASPEGNTYGNKILSNGRGESIKQFIKKNWVDFDDEVVKVKSENEDWEIIRKMIKQEQQIKHQKEIINLIETISDVDERETKIKLDYPDDYLYLKENIYPYARRVVFNFYLARKKMVEDVTYTDVIDTLYAEALTLMDRRKYIEAMPKLLEYEDWNTAICYMSLGYNEMAEKILSNEKETAERNYLLAVLAVRTKQTEKAVQLFMKACQMNDALMMRGELDPEIAEIIRKYKLDVEFLNGMESYENW